MHMGRKAAIISAAEYSRRETEAAHENSVAESCKDNPMRVPDPTYIDLAIATPDNGSVRLVITCEGKMRTFLAKPHVAARLAGELAQVLAKLVTDAEPAERS